MRLPNGSRAIASDEKLYGYPVNVDHPTSSGHAELFARLLGIDRSNAESLRTALLTAAANAEATPGTLSPHGDKYEVRFDMTGTRRSYTILSVWIIEHGSEIHRLVTAFVE